MNAARTAYKRIEYYAKKKKGTCTAHEVLADLCSQLDDSSVEKYQQSESDSVKEKEVFEGLVFDGRWNHTKYEDPDTRKLNVATIKVENGVSLDEDVLQVYVVDKEFMLPEIDITFLGACIDAAA
ncbi:unnamed protein product [Agarophyton chilense]